MSDWKKCKECGHAGYKYDEHGQEIFQTYAGQMLCSSCRIDARLADDYYSNE